MSYIPNTPDDQRAMLAKIGVQSVPELFQAIPPELRLERPLHIPPALTEMELTQAVQELATRNQSAEDAVCFLGGGSYDHFIPAVVDAVAGRSEYYTAYTPYQAEASQGSLQAFFEFQTLICQLTGLDVSNASLYDGASAVAEAVLMAMAVTQRHGQVLLAESVHPEYRRTLSTYLANLEARPVVLPTPHGYLDPDDVKRALDDDTSCVVVQHPNFFGCLEEVEALAAATHARGALFIVSFDPVSLGLLKRPGQYGADIAVAEGQCLGNPLMYGGPYLGLLACREEFVRKMPGRLVGQTVDRQGRRCWVLTMQTREQHIRREKATSNICTNQGLLALRAAVYLAALGPQGLKETAALCTRKAHYAAEQLTRMAGLQPRFQRPFFKEFTLAVPGDVPSLLSRLLQDGFHAGLPLGRWYPALGNCVSVALTEKRTRAEIDALAAAYTRELEPAPRTEVNGGDKRRATTRGASLHG
ncbi:MAG: aminomethyl-transferring glycine dehydrogenase subunit GcvPA [Planctomycetes bacterium]|nr:aminomethyl-transferring glycine dehydrogenase subunit GcvPA [Planctomycetota bacterium]